MGIDESFLEYKVDEIKGEIFIFKNEELLQVSLVKCSIINMDKKYYLGQ